MKTHVLRLLAAATAIIALPALAGAADAPGLWSVYNNALKSAKYIDLTHTITPTIPVWEGFGPSVFMPAKALVDVPNFADKDKPFTYKKNGFEATAYLLRTDQLGTQLDPPAHWAPEYPSIDELPPTFAVRPLVVIQMQDKVAKDYGHQLQLSDVKEFEAEHGPIPEGSVVFIRSDWSKEWPNPELATRTKFPGVGLEALKYLHLERHILMHGHETLDTDDTPDLDSESWLMHNGYTQAEGVANLDQVAPTGCLVEIGFPKFQGGTGGYARYVAICPADWKYGVSIGQVADAPLPKSDKPLHWDETAGVRVR